MKKIGKYEVVRELGKGATSVVYLASDPFASRDVAIKLVLAEALEDKENGKRFQKLFLTEASLAGKLSHPHIAAIYDAVSDDEGSYLVMEYVNGGTLEQHISPESLLPIKTVLEIAFKCCKALDHAHQRGIIHRDIKPANILLTEQSEIKITDFGAALTIHTDTTQISGIGSPAYMSPEQLQEADLTHQTDMFSLGVVIYQMLTGHLPFKGTTGFGMINQILTVEPDLPSTQRPEIPSSVDEIVLTCLRKKPAERFATWDDFAHELAKVFGKLDNADDIVPDAEKFSTLRQLDFFKQFSDVDLWQALRIAEWVKYSPGDVIIREGEFGTAFYILVGGEVRVTKQGKVLNILKAGECFGEMSYVGSRKHPRSASVTPVDAVTVVKVGADALAAATETCIHAFDTAFLELLVSRLEAANTRLSSLLHDQHVNIV
ncbi:MAG: protein kinase [Burkholderiales bacterium]|jgi:serine/threonine protein kinase